MKSKEDKLDVNKLVPVPVDFSKLSDVVNAKTKNTEDKIPDITSLATNTSLNTKINEVKGEIASITKWATYASLNAKINEVTGEIPNITILATTTAFTAVESRIPNISSLIKKSDYNTKTSENEIKISTDHDHDKYVTTQEFDKLTSENFTARLKQANLASKNDIANFVKKTDFDNKLKDGTSNKNELNELSKKVKAISTTDLINNFSILILMYYLYQQKKYIWFFKYIKIF